MPLRQILLDPTAVIYKLCDCYVWPIVLGEGCGLCGRCKQKLHAEVFFTLDDALHEFFRRHGRYPEEIR